MTKEPSIGPFIKDYLIKKTQIESKTKIELKIAYPYQIWHEYDLKRKESHKSISYQSFLRYIFMMETIGLLKKTDVLLKRETGNIRIPTGKTKLIRHLFVWENIPGKQTNLVKKLLSKSKYDLPWILDDKVTVEKSPDKKTIRFKLDELSADLILNKIDKKQTVTLISGDRTLDTFLVESIGNTHRVNQEVYSTSMLVKRSDSKSGTSPEDWYRQYYTAVTKILKDIRLKYKQYITDPETGEKKLLELTDKETWSDMWIRPQHYYRLYLYNHGKYGTLKGAKTKAEYEAKMKEKREKEALIKPSRPEITTIKLNRAVINFMKANMDKTDTYNSYLIRKLEIETKKKEE